MTDNHLLLYRLAELMLKHEQHVLPVDLLFDDKQIGDFVKSIQIDSPYQQMLLEGVLTESVKNEKLFVSFTVEGYFHYILGEVIYNLTVVIETENLKDLVELSKLNGAKDGVEQCLMRKVNSGNFSTLLNLIKEGGSFIEFCLNPLAYAVIIESMGNHSELYIKKSDILTELISSPISSCLYAIDKLLNKFEDLQLHSLVVYVSKMIVERLEPKSVESTLLICKSIQYCEIRQREDLLKKINKSIKIYDGDNLGKLYFNLGNQFSFIAKYDMSLKFYKKSLKIVNNIHGKESIQYSSVLRKIGWLNNDIENYKKAIKYYKEAITILYKHHINEDYFIAINLSEMAASYRGLCFYSDAIECHNKSLSIVMNLFGKYHEFTSTCFNELGLTQYYDSNYKCAVKNLKTSLEIRLKLYGEMHVEISSIYNNLGLVYCEMEDYDSAFEHHKKSLEITKLNKGEYHKNTASDYYNLAEVLYFKGDYQLAFLNYGKSYYIRRKIFGERHQSIARVYNCIGNVYRKKGLFIQSKKYFEKSLSIFQEFLGEKHEHTKLVNNKLNDITKVLQNNQ